MRTFWCRNAIVTALVFLGLAASAAGQGVELLVGNVQVSQRPFTAVFDVTYDLQTVGDCR